MWATPSPEDPHRKCGQICEESFPGAQRLPRFCHQGDLGGEALSTFKREHMAPGEMEKSSSPKALLDKAADEIVISVEKGKLR